MSEKTSSRSKGVMKERLSSSIASPVSSSCLLSNSFIWGMSDLELGHSPTIRSKSSAASTIIFDDALK